MTYINEVIYTSRLGNNRNRMSATSKEIEEKSDLTFAVQIASGIFTFMIVLGAILS